MIVMQCTCKKGRCCKTMSSHEHIPDNYLDAHKDIVKELKLQGIIEGDAVSNGMNGRVYSSKNNRNNVVKVFNCKNSNEEAIIEHKDDFINEIQTICNLNKSIKEGITQIINSKYYEIDGNYVQYYEMPKYCKYYRHKDAIKILNDFIYLFEILDNIHKFGYVHLDIKPDNIMIYNNKPIIIDFGCARKNDVNIKLPRGPKWFKPPELLSDLTAKNPLAYDVDYVKSDIYMMSKTLWAMLQGDIYADKGFCGDYSRNYLQNTVMRINLNCEPLHLLFENTIISDWCNRLSIEKCKELLQNQVDILSRQYDKNNTNANYDLLKSIHYQKPNRLIYSDSDKFEAILQGITKVTIIRLSDTKNMHLDSVLDFEKERLDIIAKNHYIIKSHNKLIHISIRSLEIFKANEYQFTVKLCLDDMDHVKDKYRLLPMSRSGVDPKELDAICYLDSDYEIQVKLDSEYEKLSLSRLL